MFLENLPRHLAIAAMLVGPRKAKSEGGAHRYNRIEHATRVASTHGLRLVIAGDANGGNDIEHFRAFAEDRGVATHGVFDPRGRTLADVQSIQRLLVDHPDYAHVRYVVLITDGWHMDRASEYVIGEGRQILGTRDVTFIREPCTGHEATAEQIAAELKGIEDYRNGRYDPIVAEWTGKPSLDRLFTPNVTNG